MFPAMVIRYNMGWCEMILIDAAVLRRDVPFCNFYMVCQRRFTDWLVR